VERALAQPHGQVVVRRFNASDTKSLLGFFLAMRCCCPGRRSTGRAIQAAGG